MKRLTYFTIILGLMALLVLAPAATAQTTGSDQTAAVTTAVSWLIDTHQNEDGGYTGFSSGAGIAPSDVGGTVDALLAIGSGGYNPTAALDFLRQDADAVAAYAATDGSTAGKLLLAVTAAHQNPRSFAGLDLVELLAQQEQPTGQFGVDNAFGQALAILGLAAAGETVPQTAVTWLLEQQADDGSWDDGFGTMGNSDATALAIMALVAADGPDTDGLDAAVDFLAQAQLPDGGWEYGPGFGFSLNSTALVTQALAAVGVDIADAAGAWAANGRSPLDVLLAAQSETGAFQADFGDGPFDDFFTTVQAIPALTGQPFPLPAYYVAAAQGASCLLTLQDPDSGGWEEFATFGPNAAGTARTVLALTAVGEETDEALQVLAEQAPDYLLTSFGGGVGLIMQAVAAAGGDVTDFAGTDLTALMAENLADSGEYDDTSFGPYGHARAIAGLLAAGLEPDPTAVAWLLDNHDDGDWGGGPDANGLALYVLARLDMAPAEAVETLRQSQQADGGWGFDSASPSSSFEVARGLVAVGENPFAPQWSRVVDGTLTNAAAAVLAMQGDNGCWPNLFGPGDDPYSTTDAIQLLALAAEAPFGLAETATSTGPVQAVAAEPDPEPTAEPTPEALPTNTPLSPLSDDPNRAALVIVLEDGLTVERCVAFDEPQLSGYDLLQRADLDLVVDVSGAGAAVCAIEGSGCPADDCFCECGGADCVYWAYWYQQDGRWQYAQVGAASYQVQPGDVQAWVWGPGSPAEAPEPPAITFDDVCGTAVEEIAAEPDSVVEETAVVEEPAAAETAEPATNWLPYALFGLLVLLLGGGLLLARQKG